MKNVLAVLLAILVTNPLAAMQEAQPAQQKDTPKTVTFSVKDQKLTELVDKIHKNTGVRIIVEKAADIKVSGTLNDVAIEDAISSICKENKLEWRRIFVRADSPLLKKPDSLASTVRLMGGLQFPNLIIDKSSAKDAMVHVASQQAVDAIPIALRKDLGMVLVYIITNDAAAKTAEEKANTRVAKYMELNKELMKLFMEMTPEEREQAMASGLQMVQNLDPKYMLEMTKSVLKMGPEALQPLMEQQTQMFFQMTPEDRRAIMRMQMQSMKYITPEQMKIIQEDAMEVMKEMGVNPGQSPMQ